MTISLAHRKARPSNDNTSPAASLLQTCAAFQIEQMMIRQYAAIEAREAAEEEARQQEHRIALVLQPGPVPVEADKGRG